MNRTDVSSPPLYCSKDGMRLLDKRTDIPRGYDPFTGVERPHSEHVTRECPTKGHDVWVLTGDGEAWVRP